MTADIRLLRWPDRDREDYERLSSALARVRDAAARSRGEIVATVPTGPVEPSDVDRARALLAQRRQRDAMAGPLADLFGEPGWDILLTLFIAQDRGDAPSGDALRRAMTIRRPVLSRWLTLLARRGLIGAPGADDGGLGTPLALTEAGRALVLRCIGDA